jgi:hypothetical protein
MAYATGYRIVANNLHPLTISDRIIEDITVGVAIS